MKTRMYFLTGLMVAAACNLGAQELGQNAALPAPPAVQSPAPDIPATCDYNACALRTKLSWGSWRIIRGEQEQEVVRLGMFRAPNIESIVSTSPEALAEVRAFRKNYTSGEVMQVLGVFLMGAGIALASANNSAALSYTAVGGGGALLFYGVSRHVNAFNALHKTIWLYNRSLKR